MWLGKSQLTWSSLEDRNFFSKHIHGIKPSFLISISLNTEPTLVCDFDVCYQGFRIVIAQQLIRLEWTFHQAVAVISHSFALQLTNRRVVIKPHGQHQLDLTNEFRETPCKKVISKIVSNSKEQNITKTCYKKKKDKFKEHDSVTYENIKYKNTKSCLQFLPFLDFKVVWSNL